MLRRLSGAEQLKQSLLFISPKNFTNCNRKEVYFLNDVGHIVGTEDCQLRSSGLSKNVKARARKVTVYTVLENFFKRWIFKDLKRELAVLRSNSFAGKKLRWSPLQKNCTKLLRVLSVQIGSDFPAKRLSIYTNAFQRYLCN